MTEFGICTVAKVTRLSLILANDNSSSAKVVLSPKVGRGKLSSNAPYAISLSALWHSLYTCWLFSNSLGSIGVEYCLGMSCHAKLFAKQMSDLEISPAR
jgi:hypothetical protein